MANETDNYILPLFRIRNGEGFYIVDDEEIPKQKWEVENPKPETIIRKKNYKGINPDGTHIPH